MRPCGLCPCVRRGAGRLRRDMFFCVVERELPEPFQRRGHDLHSVFYNIHPRFSEGIDDLFVSEILFVYEFPYVFGADDHAHVALREFQNGTDGIVKTKDVSVCGNEVEPAVDLVLYGLSGGNDERHVFQRGKLYAVAAVLRERVVRVADNAPRFAVQEHAVVVFHFYGFAHDADIHQIFIEFFLDFVAVARPCAETDMRRDLVELLYDLRDDADAAGARRAYGNDAVFGITHALQVLFGLFEKIYDLFRLLFEVIPLFGQPDLPLAADEEGNAELLFEQFHLSAEGRLGQEQFFGGAGYVLFLRYREKVS